MNIDVTKIVKDKNKQKRLELALQEIHKIHGEDSINTADGKPMQNVEVISTQCPSIDYLLLGIGGVPRGRITEIFGVEGAGKSSLCLHLVAEMQRLGGVAAFIDMEHALSLLYARRIGVNTQALLLSQPSFGEEALQVAESLIKTNVVDLVVVDSVASLTPKAELDGEIGDSHVGLQARMMGQAMRMLTGAVETSNTALVFTNQIRENIGPYMPKEAIPGGRALKFYASMRLDIRKQDFIKGENGIIIGQTAKIRTVKNKLSPPFREVLVDIIYGEGFSREGSLLDVAADIGIVNKSGAWYSYGEIRLGQGRPNSAQFLKENKELYYEIYEKVGGLILSTPTEEVKDE